MVQWVLPRIEERHCYTVCIHDPREGEVEGERCASGSSKSHAYSWEDVVCGAMFGPLAEAVVPTG